MKKMENIKNSLSVTSDQLLESIFDITQNLYKEMCVSDNEIESDHAEIFRLLTELGRTLADADRASFWKWDKRAHTLWTTAAVGEERITIPEGTGLVGRSLAERKALVTNDPYNCPDFNSDVDKKTGYTTKSVLVMPISDCKGEFIGAYQVINKIGNDGKFDLESDCRRLSLAAFICGITLESQTFLEDSQHDKLTELKNRMGFYSDFASTYNKHLANGKSLSMFISDIDHFKHVNDTYGHNAGDAVLRHAAKLISTFVPEGGNIYRWGGEEFIMLIPDRNMDEAAELAEKIRIALMESVCTFEGTDIKMTMSFGINEFDGKTSIDDVVKGGDEKLYTAKESGRNRVVK